MDVFAASTDVSIEIDLLDAAGTQIVADTDDHDYVVLDETDAIVASGVVALTVLDASATIAVPAASNAITGARGARVVRLTVLSAGQTHVLERTYVLEDLSQVLSVPETSAQSWGAAAMLAVGMTGLDAWALASERERKTALAAAYANLSLLRYLPWRQDEDAPASERALELRQGGFRLNELSVDDWALLPAHFKRALARAQLVEADVLLDGDPDWERRVSGLMSETVGESSRMWRSGKPVISRTSQRTLRELAGYIDHSVRISR